MLSQRCLLAASRILLLVICFVALPSALRAQIWTVVGIDPKGDARDPAAGDAVQVCYRYDKQQDFLWFRVTLWGKAKEDSFGVNIAADTGTDDAAKMNWWGANKDFKFDKLITAWVTRARGGYEGTIGVADAAGVKAKNFTNLFQNNLQLRVEGDSIIVGLKRTDLTDKTKMNFIASVGSGEQWNDDIPNTRSAVLDLAATRPKRGIREIDVGRNNFRFPTGYKTLPDNQPPQIVRKGRGRETLILIPGVYSGSNAFDGFIARNESQYRFYLVTPPGLNGTPARPLPPETVSYGELTWTRRLESDILELIRRERVSKPVIVTHGFPGSLAAHELATQHPEIIGGVIDLAAMPVQFMPSFKEPGKKASIDERVEMVNQGWGEKWFKYVTPETWESNNYPSEMFANDAARGEEARKQVEANALPVKIRYLVEFMAADNTPELSNLKTPLLALIPGFNQTLLADPANSFFKIAFQSAWDPFSKNPQIRLLTIPDARALLLDDQPKAVDEAIAAFVRDHSSSLL